MTRSTAMAMACEDENLVDYFIIATKPLDTASSSDSPAQLAFVYPPVDDDHDETEFCENVAMFTFPHGYVHSYDGRSLPPPPAHNLFTLTDAQGDHLYGASLSFFESSGRAATHAKSLCVLTRRPFYTQMLRYLEQLLLLGLYQQQQHGEQDQLSRSTVESALCNLFHEVPVPYRGLAVQFQIASLEIVLERPPFLDFPYEMDTELMLYTFMMIDPKNLQQLYHHVLLEHRVLIVGNDSVLVTAVVETLKSLVFPLTWLHVVIPNIPDSLDLSTLLDAPVPFLAGAHTTQLLDVVIPSNVVKYDLNESRLVVPTGAVASGGGGGGGQYTHAHQMDLESVVLPPLPEVSTRLLRKLSTTRLADLHTQKKELQQKLWDRRIQLQKCCMASSSGRDSNGPAVISPRGFFLVKQSLVHKKMIKLYLEVIATMLQDFPQCVTVMTASTNKPFASDLFISKKHGNAKVFYQTLTETAQFQSFIAQHTEYVAGQLALEDAMKFHFVHKTLLSAERITGNQAEASVAVAMALTKTFVALAPQPGASSSSSTEQPTSTSTSSKAEPTRRGDVVFPMLHHDAFGEPRQIQFPSMATDAIHSSLGTFISPGASNSRRASKDTSDWMQSFMRTVPLASAFSSLSSSSTSYSGHSNSHSSSNNQTSSSHSERSLLRIFGSSTASPAVTMPVPAPFKRSRTIDRLRKAAPFYRTMTQKALDSTLNSLASATAAVNSSTSSSSSQQVPQPAAASIATTTRPSTVVRSIWLITTSACKCRDRVALFTHQLVEQLTRHNGSKTAPSVTDAYCELIHALALCHHASEAKAVFEECLSGSALVSLASIASLPHFWRPFSALLRCYVVNGLVQRAFDLLAHVELQEEQLLDPSLGALQFTAHVMGADKETLVERVFVTFSCGNLGLCLAPRGMTTAVGMGCELIAFEGDHDDHVDPLATGLSVHDVVETINGEMVLHREFQEIITLLKTASRPMTVTFVRGLDQLDSLTAACGGRGCMDEELRRSSSSFSSTSLSSTSAVVDGKSSCANSSSSRSSSSKATPRRDLCDRYGLLPTRGIRITALSDCECCGTRLSLSQVQRGWSPSDPNDFTTTCVACAHKFVPRLCVMLGVMTALYQPTSSGTGASHRPAGTLGTHVGTLLPPDAVVDQFEYLSMPVIRKTLSDLAQKVQLPLLTMAALRERNPRIYWNIVVKLLSLDVPLDFMELPDVTSRKTTTTTTKTKSRDFKPVASQPGATGTATGITTGTGRTRKDEEEMRVLRSMVMKRAERIQSDNPSQKMADVLASVIKSLEQQTRAELQQQTKFTAVTGNVRNAQGRKRWSLLGNLHASPRATTSPVVPVLNGNHSREKNGIGNGEEDDRQSEDDDEEEEDDGREEDRRETEVEDMRSSRTLSVTESSTVSDELLAAAAAPLANTKTKTSKFMPSLAAAAPFRRSIARTTPQ